MADIFLSYSSKDKDRITPFVEILEREGWSVWWDLKIRIGKTFDQVIEEELAKAKCVVVLLSIHSVQSDWVKSEASEGKNRQILAPVLIDNVPIPLEFRRTETANLYDWNGDPSHPELKLLLTAIREIIEHSSSTAATGGKPADRQDVKPVPLSDNRKEGKTGLSKTFITFGIMGILGLVLIVVFFIGFFSFSGKKGGSREIDEEAQNTPIPNSDNLKNKPEEVKENKTNTSNVNRVNRFNTLRNPNLSNIKKDQRTK